MVKYVRVHILDVPYHADIEYTYALPDGFLDEVRVGSVVIVPFGASNRQKTALVTAIDENSEHTELKSII